MVTRVSAVGGGVGVVGSSQRRMACVWSGGVSGVGMQRLNGGGGVARRVEESEVVGWIDRLTRSIFGVRRKSPPEKFSGGGDGGRRWLRVAE
ncbi:hypothetical protein Tco_1466617 [Tanacetum coccineum]